LDRIHFFWKYMSVVERNNVRLTGSGPKSIIFSHGYGCDQTVWRDVAPAFEADYRVVLFDHAGHGGSDLSQYDFAKYGTLQGFADDLLEIAGELELENAIFVGHSVGATIGMLAALKSPRVFDRLVFVAPSPCFINEENYLGGFSRSDIEELLALLDSNHLGWSSKMAPFIMGNPDRPELAAELTNSFCRTDPKIARHFARVAFLSDVREKLHLLSHPALILQCSDDPLAPRAVGQFMHQHLPDSRLLVLNAEGHCPHMSTPDQTVSAIRSFL
jgi:sigma-B regulation protein RsbQ